MITIGNIFHTNPAEFDEVWIICFSVAEIQELFAIKNVRHVPELAPREELFWIYRTMVHANQWNKSSFEKYYVPRFLKDIQNSSSIKLLKKLVSLSKKEDIRLACFCTDEESTCVIDLLLPVFCFIWEPTSNAKRNTVFTE